MSWNEGVSKGRVEKATSALVVLAGMMVLGSGDRYDSVVLELCIRACALGCVELNQHSWPCQSASLGRRCPLNS